jgi:hypothetical protein
MLYREIIAVCSQIHTKHKNTLCGAELRIIYKDRVRTAQKTLSASVIKNDKLMLYREKNCCLFCDPRKTQNF